MAVAVLSSDVTEARVARAHCGHLAQHQVTAAVGGGAADRGNGREKAFVSASPVCCSRDSWPAHSL